MHTPLSCIVHAYENAHGYCGHQRRSKRGRPRREEAGNHRLWRQQQARGGARQHLSCARPTSSPTRLVYSARCCHVQSHAAAGLRH